MTTTEATRNWNTLADDTTLDRTVQELQANGITTTVVDSRDEAKQCVLELIPEGSEVFTAASATLQATGLAEAINESGRYNSIRKKFASMDRATQGAEMRRMGASPDYVLGSVHAITEHGHVITASYGGSQLASYVHGGGKVIWVAGANKIVKNLEEGIRRIEQHSLPLEDQRLMGLLGRHSHIGKLLIVRLEPIPGRTTLILVKEELGF